MKSRQLNVKKRHGDTVQKMVVVVLASSIGLNAGCSTVHKQSVSVGTAPLTLTEIDDQMVGKNILGLILQLNAPVSDTSLDTKLDEVISALNQYLGEKEKIVRAKVYILDYEGIAIYTLPGGYFCVHREAIEKLPPDALFVLFAHELGHQSLRHAMKLLRQCMGEDLLLSISFRELRNSVVAQAQAIIYNTIVLGYPPAWEQDAQRYAKELLSRAGFQSQAANDLNTRMRGEKQSVYTKMYLHGHFMGR